MTSSDQRWLHHPGQCVDGPPTEDHHDIDGKDLDRCEWHLRKHELWLGARDQHVSRARKQALAAGLPFDREATVRAREAETPYDLRRRPDRYRGAMPVPPDQVRRLRTTVTELLQAKTALDAAHRDEAPMSVHERLRLLKAIEKHTALLDALLRQVEQG